MTTPGVSISLSRTPLEAPESRAPSDAPPVGRRDFAFAAGLAACAVAVTFDAWRSIFYMGANNEELSYVLLAPPMIVWIAWSRHEQIKKCRLRGGWVGLLILIVGWCVYSYGFVADPVLWRAGAVMTVCGAVATALGSDVLFRFMPAFVATAFLIPISPNGRYRLAVPLQNATAQWTQAVCDLLGIYVERAGNLLTINGKEVTVAEACNGMRMILTLFLVCYVVAFTQRMRTWIRVLLLLGAPLVAIVSNVTRLVPTVWMFGNARDAAGEQAAHTFHDISGWVMTILAFLLLVGTVRLLEEILPEREAKPAKDGLEGAAATTEAGALTTGEARR